MAKKKSGFDDMESFEFINEQDEYQQERQKGQEEKNTSKQNIKEKQVEVEKNKHEQKSQKEDKANQSPANLDEAEEYKNLLQLTKAEFDNYRKRSFTLLQNAKTEGEINIILKFLPALDSFKKAKQMISDDKVLKGVEMIEKDIIDALKTVGVEEIDPTGKPFDANFHNAISVISNPESPEGVVEQVYQNGYCYNGKVIRYAQVIINKL